VAGCRRSTCRTVPNCLDRSGNPTFSRPHYAAAGVRGSEVERSRRCLVRRDPGPDAGVVGVTRAKRVELCDETVALRRSRISGVLRDANVELARGNKICGSWYARRDSNSRPSAPEGKAAAAGRADLSGIQGNRGGVLYERPDRRADGSLGRLTRRVRRACS
jgi:hypothetical protein